MSLTKLDIDRFISTLRTKSKEFNSISNVQLASMLEETISNIKKVFIFWATICSDNKGTTKNPAEGEEWLGGPFASVLATQYYIKSLTNDDDLAEKKNTTVKKIVIKFSQTILRSVLLFHFLMRKLFLINQCHLKILINTEDFQKDMISILP